ncbi:hypothetical protein GFS24_05385 [Chitinophaga sp. SYP-B3965]|uniref:hypothetical protein n=1 Tax=Chitinophaga sp. SYP-B3965 TaxID=2663120 RepID=UPI001299BA95|nr:hypothetical protein [Chitinophaga sp. SYP-B3965]MRG44534.1 hypothetical protein [Chitinophaga sp. SYP-B3965]
MKKAIRLLKRKKLLAIEKFPRKKKKKPPFAARQTLNEKHSHPKKERKTALCSAANFK